MFYWPGNPKVHWLLAWLLTPAWQSEFVTTVWLVSRKRPQLGAAAQNCQRLASEGAEFGHIFGAEVLEPMLFEVSRAYSMGLSSGAQAGMAALRQPLRLSRWCSFFRSRPPSRTSLSLFSFWLLENAWKSQKHWFYWSEARLIAHRRIEPLLSRLYSRFKHFATSPLTECHNSWFTGR
jgi:hypothetical protein